VSKGVFPVTNAAGVGDVRAGKLPPQVLAGRVLRYTGKRRDDVLVHASLGEDSCAVAYGDWACVLSSDPITGAAADAGWYSIHVSCNDIAAMGAEPVGVLLTVLVPPEGDPAAGVENVMRQAAQAAEELGIEIMGGHTEVLPGLSQPIVCATAVGRVARERLVTSGGARPGQVIILTKGAGLEGTAILAQDYGDVLKARLGEELVARAAALARRLSVVPEGLLAARLGATAMHDATEGGVLGAAYELAEAAGAGVLIEEGRVPVLEETAALCRLVGCNPLRLISSGAMLIVTPSPESLLVALADVGIQGAIIGQMLPAGRHELRRADGTESRLGPPTGDELWVARRRLEELRTGGL